MARRARAVLTVLLAGVIVLAGTDLIHPVQAKNEPIKMFSTFTPTPTNTLEITPTPVWIMTATAVPTMSVNQPEPITDVQFGWPGQVQCYNCSPFAAKVILSSYNPAAYNPNYPRLNCWMYSEDHNWCLSPTWIGVPWESVYGFGAACPVEWPIGTWVVIDGVGAYICFDHGGDIVCDDGTCRVDILGPGGAAWDGEIFDATLWVPTSFLLRLSEDK